MQEPEPEAQPEPAPMPYAAPQPDPTRTAELEAGTDDEPELEPGTEAASETEPYDEPETLDLPDEVDLRDTPAAATEGQPFVGDTGVYRERWATIKASFVDEPRTAVQSADRLVTEAMEDRAKVLMSHHGSLQARWCEDDDVDTERLRVVFHDYRTFLFGPLST